MRRRQLFEFGDQRWLPNAFRNYLTNILSYQAGIIYRFALPKLIEVLQQTRAKEILDLCSGTGGPWPVLAPILNERAPYPIQITLSDKYPPKEISCKNTFLNYHPNPIDVLNIPEGLPNLRTLFTGFHHFSPKEAKNILAQAIKSNSTIAIFEFTEREKKKILSTWRAPSLVFRLTKQMPQLSRGQRFWTYFIPVVPLIYAWDAMVSHCRTYTVPELREMATAMGPEIYQWDCGQIGLPGGAQRISYLIGQPSKKRNTAQSKKEAHIPKDGYDLSTLNVSESI